MSFAIGLNFGSSPANTGLVSQGAIVGPLVVADDYLSANGRDFQFDINPIVGETASAATCFLGLQSVHKDKLLVEGSITEIVVAGVPKWRLAFEIPTSKTLGFRAADFDYTVEVRGASGARITQFYGCVAMRDSQTD